MAKRTSHSHCPGITRRSFLADTGMGFTRLALGAMLFKDGVARADESTWRPPDGSRRLANTPANYRCDAQMRSVTDALRVWKLLR